MTLSTQELDRELNLRLESYSEANEEYWSFRGEAARGHMHCYFQYPGMMVPQMQGRLIDAVTAVMPHVRRVYDPFVGSGTVMTEAMVRGLDFTGQDINPLAVLVCRAKSESLYEHDAVDKTQRLLEAMRADKSSRIDADFPGLDKWFRQDVAIGLSRIRRAIREEQELWCRRLFWVALAETVRLTSNSRTSTFKLHLRPESEIRSRTMSPIQTFEETVHQNLRSLSAQKALLEERNLLEGGRYRGAVEIILGDTSRASAGSEKEPTHDLLVTSPPYGDNKSTIPYGQHSYLPLQWIDLQDIDQGLDRTWLATTLAIDTRSLGGTRVNALRDAAELYCLSDSLKRTIDALKGEPPDRAQRVAAFWRDFNRCLDPIVAAVRPNAYMVWTVGNRRVANRQIPADEILCELLSARGATLVAKLRRAIPAKRMATRNSVATTMRAETVLIMRRGDC